MAGTNWNEFVDGTRAYGSEVNENFDWAEGHLVPHSAGTTIDAVYDLGSTTTRWANLYVASTGSIGLATSSSVPLHVALGYSNLGTQSSSVVAVFQNNATTTNNASFYLVAGDSGEARLMFGDTTSPENAGMIAYIHSTNQMEFHGNGGTLTVMGAGGTITATEVRPGKIDNSGDALSDRVGIRVGTTTSIVAPLTVAVTSGSGYPSINSSTVAVFAYSETTTSDANVAIVSGANGACTLFLGDTTGLPGYIKYTSGSDAMIFGVSGTSLLTIQGNKYFIVDGRMTQSVQSIARAWLNGAQTVVDGLTTTVAFSGEDIDTGAEFTTGSGAKFTASYAGFYRISAQVEMENLGNTTTAFMYLLISKNGTGVAYSYAQIDHALNGATSTTMRVCQVEDVVQLAASDWVSIDTYQSSGANQSLTPGSTRTFVSINRILG